MHGHLCFHLWLCSSRLHCHFHDGDSQCDVMLDLFCSFERLTVFSQFCKMNPSQSKQFFRKRYSDQWGFTVNDSCTYIGGTRDGLSSPTYPSFEFKWLLHSFVHPWFLLFMFNEINIFFSSSWECFDSIHSIDATATKGHLCHLVNDAPSKSAYCNAEMRKIKVGNSTRLCLFATRDIHNGEELLYDYGDEKNLWWRTKVSYCFRTANFGSQCENQCSTMSPSYNGVVGVPRPWQHKIIPFRYRDMLQR